MSRPSEEQLRKTHTFFESEGDVEDNKDDPPTGSDQVPDSPNVGAFDKLSEKLGELARSLGEAEAEHEKSLRPALVEGLEHYSGDRKKTSKLLNDYKRVFKSKRQWSEVAKAIGAALDCSDRTVFRMVDEYNASLLSKGVPDPEFDRMAINGRKLTIPEKRMRNARIAIRVFLNNFPESEREKKLTELFAEESHQVWGAQEPFSITLKVIPRPSTLTIDGRMKPIAMLVEENAA
jgi:hypothetical protein